MSLESAEAEVRPLNRNARKRTFRTSAMGSTCPSNALPPKYESPISETVARPGKSSGTGATKRPRALRKVCVRADMFPYPSDHLMDTAAAGTPATSTTINSQHLPHLHSPDQTATLPPSLPTSALQSTGKITATTELKGPISSPPPPGQAQYQNPSLRPAKLLNGHGSEAPELDRLPECLRSASSSRLWTPSREHRPESQSRLPHPRTGLHPAREGGGVQ